MPYVCGVTSYFSWRLHARIKWMGRYSSRHRNALLAGWRLSLLFFSKEVIDPSREGGKWDDRVLHLWLLSAQMAGRTRSGCPGSQGASGKSTCPFQERCKNAGEKIYKTVEGVEAIAILRTRRYVDTRPQIMEDPFGAAGNPWESDYPLSFLLPRQKNGQFMGGWMTYKKFHDEWDRPGYAYVDLRDQDDNSIVRYTLAIAFPKQDSTRESGEKFDDSGEPRPYRFVVNPFPSPGPIRAIAPLRHKPEHLRPELIGSGGEQALVLYSGLDRRIKP